MQMRTSLCDEAEVQSTEAQRKWNSLGCLSCLSSHGMLGRTKHSILADSTMVSGMGLRDNVYFRMRLGNISVDSKSLRVIDDT